VLLIVLGCALAPISVLGVWTANQVSDTDRYIANVTPLIREPAVRGALTDKIAAAVSRQVDVQGVARQAATQLSRRGFPGSVRCCPISPAPSPVPSTGSFTAPSRRP
jgi:hypothetical protein